MQRFFTHGLCLCLALVPALPLMAASSTRPNIVIVLADDMGYSDIGCYGGEVKTPTLDGLARKGLRFTDFYNTGRCCPTRASLLTGLYPHQAGVGHMVEPGKSPGYLGHLNERCVTIAEVLRGAGYRTACFGKWHVTPFDYKTGEASHRDSWPLQRGFDHYLGSLAGGGNYYDPKAWMEDNGFKQPGKDFYYTDVVADAAADYVGKVDAAQPLFMYVAFTAPHWPLHVPEEEIGVYQSVYEAGWDAIRAARCQRMLEMGLIDPRWKISPRDSRVEPWSDRMPDRAWRARQMATYAAMIQRMDSGIGRMVSALEKAGRLDNTLLVFLSDNGGCEETPGMPGIKRFAKEGQDTSLWGNRSDVQAGPPGTFQSYGTPWANVSNTPFRWYKTKVHEGGISTPLIAHWPAGIGAGVQGSLVREPGHLIDLMATCVEVSGAVYPSTYGKREVLPMEGISLAPSFRGEAIKRQQPIFFEHQGHQAMRDGPLKIVRMRKGEWELYNVVEDRGEMHDLAAQQPERLKAMRACWDAWAVRADVIGAEKKSGK